MINISFDRPYLLLLVIPLLLVTIIPFLIAIRKTNRTKGAVGSFILHIILSVVVSLVASGASISRVITETNVIVLADVSYSTNKDLDTVDEYIRTVEDNLPDNSKMGVIAFGKDSYLTTMLGERFTTIKGTPVDDSATDIKTALTHAASLFTNDAIRRIVIITDGKDTVGRFDGAVATIDALHKADVYIDAIYIDSNAEGGDKEIQLTSVDYNPSTFKGHKATADALIESSSSESVRAIAILKHDGREIARENVTLTEGFNVVNIPLPTDEAGEFLYTVEVECVGDGEDTSGFNNKYTFSQKVAENIRVLLVSNNAEDLTVLRSHYGEDAVIDAYIGDADVPCTTDELIEYDEYVLSDVDIRRLNNSKSFITTIESLVGSYGKSLLTFGDLSLQNKISSTIPGEDEEESEASDPTYDTITGMLPVKFGNSDQDSKLLCLVIDTSRSMQFAYKLEVAKNAALQLVNVMNDRDFLIIVSFSGDFNTEWPSSQIEGNREKIAEVIKGLEPTQGTVLGKGMKEAYDKVTASGIEDKQVFLISDGRTWANETDNAVDIAADLYELGIPTSVLNTGTAVVEGDDASGDAVNLLEDIALAGRGGDESAPVKNYFFSKDPDKVNDVVLGEVANMITETVVEGDISVKIKIPSDSTLSGITTSLPHLGGYIFAREQSTATTVLAAEYKTSGGASLTVPIYAYRRYERGRVASFTSSLSGDWVSLWQNEIGKAVFTNIIDTATPKSNHSYPFDIEIIDESGAKLIKVVPERLDFDATAVLTVKTPGGKSREYKLPFNSEGYTHTLYTEDIGYYDIDVSYTSRGVTHTASKEVYIPFLPEYDAFTLYSISDLHRLIRAKGEVHENADFEIINDKDDVASYTFYLATPLMIAAAAIFVIDIILRKLRWQDIVTLFKKKHTREEKQK